MKFLTSIILILSFSCQDKKLLTHLDCENDTKAIINYVKAGEYDKLHMVISKYENLKKRNVTEQDLIAEFSSLKQWLKENSGELTFKTYEEKSVQESNWGSCFVRVYSDSIIIYEGKYTKQYSDNFQLDQFNNEIKPNIRKKASDLPAPPKK